MKSNIGLIGLGTMGANLARNISNKGFSISVFNRTFSKTEEFLEEFGTNKIHGHQEIKDFIESLELPRKVIILVKAGAPVDTVIEQIKPYLSEKDIIIDCGNSNFEDTIRRQKTLEKENLHFIGSGVSGGEEGALNGPSLMPGGKKEAWNQIKEIFEAISAKDFEGKPCVNLLGPDAAGHYVKMVHNGIEYGIMEIIAEISEILRINYSLPSNQIAEFWQKINNSNLKSFLTEISVEIFDKKEKNGDFLINKILDKAGQKGTGKWTVIDALQRGVDASIISSAVFARIISGEKETRTKLSQNYLKVRDKLSFTDQEFEKLKKAFYLSTLLSYIQGFELIKKASHEENWSIDLAEVARVWQGGCIIRADLLKEIRKAFQKSDQNLLFSDLFEKDIKETIPYLQKTVEEGVSNNLYLHTLSTSLNYIIGITEEKLGANIIQGLRDNFGAHTYQRIDQEGTFHTEWS